MIRLTNQTNIPVPLFEEMSRMYASHPKMDRKHFSATEMNKSVKDVVFTRLHDETVDIDIQYRMKPIRGTWFHLAMESLLKKRKDCICENRYFMEIPVETELGEETVNLSGAIDCLWDNSGEYEILDYKNSNQTKIDKESTDEDSEWKRQMYVYARLVEINTGRRPKHAYMVCFDDSKRAGEIDLTDTKSLVCQWFSIDLSDMEYEKKLFEDIRDRLSRIVNCLSFGYTAPECSDSEDWMTEPRFGVKKTDKEDMWRTKASLEEAVELISTVKGSKEGYHIYELPRCPKKCLKHCDHSAYCEQGRKLVDAFMNAGIKEYDWEGKPVEKSKESV